MTKSNQKKITIVQIASAARRKQDQTDTLIGLGLNKLHRTRSLEDTPSVRGMIKKVQHLLRIVEEK
jgi:large subunit ribosomal protein L30